MPVIKTQPRKSIPVYYTTPAWGRLRERVLERDRYRCFYCGGQATTADHVTPRGWGGADLLINLVACCELCNTIAGGKNFRKRTAKKAWIARERKKIADPQHFLATMRLVKGKRR